MRNDRVRKKKIRAHMSATGQPFVLAARTVEEGGFSYLRTGWSSSAWSRLLPLQAMDLEVVISTASVTDQDGDLAALVADHPVGTRHPDGIDTALTWQDRDEIDAQAAQLRHEAQAAFGAAVTALGRPVPTTMADLADLLAEIGVFTHTRTAGGGHRWRAPEDLPDPMDVLPTPVDWVRREDRIR